VVRTVLASKRTRDDVAALQLARSGAPPTAAIRFGPADRQPTIERRPGPVRHDLVDRGVQFRVEATHHEIEGRRPPVSARLTPFAGRRATGRARIAAHRTAGSSTRAR